MERKAGLGCAVSQANAIGLLSPGVVANVSVHIKLNVALSSKKPWHLVQVDG